MTGFAKSFAGSAAPRVVIRFLHILPALAAIGILPILLQAIPNAVARGNWRSAAFVCSYCRGCSA